MTAGDPPNPHVLPPRPEPCDTGADRPPPRGLAPGAGREVLFHWILTVGGFTAMLLIGRYFAG